MIDARSDLMAWWRLLSHYSRKLLFVLDVKLLEISFIHSELQIYSSTQPPMNMCRFKNAHKGSLWIRTSTNTSAWGALVVVRHVIFLRVKQLSLLLVTWLVCLSRASFRTERHSARPRCSSSTMDLDPPPLALGPGNAALSQMTPKKKTNSG